MPVTSTTRRISPKEWEDHKDRIIELYLDQNRKLLGHDGVIETMKQEGFVATKSQYEAQFRGWNVRKNMTSRQWTEVIPNIQESQRRGKLRQICLSGRVIPSSRIERAQRRYASGRHQATERVHGNDRGTLRSEALSISTERGHIPVEEEAPEEEDLLPLEMPDEAVGLPISEEFNNFDFDMNMGNAGDLVSSIFQERTSNHHSPSRTHPLGFSPRDVMEIHEMNYHQQIPINSHITGVSFDAAGLAIAQTSTPNLLSPSIVDGSQSHQLIFPRNIWIGPLPSTKVVALAVNNIYDIGLSTSTQSSVSNIARYGLVGQFLADLKESILIERESIFIRRGLKNIAELPPIPSSLPVLSYLLSEETFVGEQQRQILLSDDAFESRLYSRLIRSIVNGFAGLENIPTSGILKFLNRNRRAQSLLIRFLRSGPSCEAKSLAENIFQAALEADDIKIVQLLLELRLVDANGTVCLCNRQRHTPLQLAVRKQSFGVIGFLLDSKVDVNKSFSSGPKFDALSLLVRSQDAKSTFGESFLQLIDGFLKANAIVQMDTAMYAVLIYVDLRLARVLIDRVASQNPLKLISRKHCLTEIIKSFEEPDATCIIKGIMERCRQLGDYQHLDRFCLELDDALNTAAEHGNMELVKILLPYSENLDEAFRWVIKNGNQEVIDIILKENPDLDREIGGITPLSAALESRNQKLITFLEEKAVLDRLHGGKQFNPAITSALNVGNVTYATKLLDLMDRGFGVNWFELTSALDSALTHDHDDIAWRLLTASAPAVPDSMAIDIGSPLYPLNIALKKKKSDIVRAMLDCYAGISSHLASAQWSSILDAAIEWGDDSILHDILRICPRFSSSALKLALEKKSLNEFWTIIKSSSQSSRLQQLKYAVIAAVRREDASLLYELFDFGARPDDDVALAEAMKHHPSMVEPLLKGVREAWPQIRDEYAVKAITLAVSQYPTNAKTLDALLALRFESVNGHQHYHTRLHKIDFEMLLEVAIKRSKYGGGGDHSLQLIKKLFNASADTNGIISVRLDSRTSHLNPCLLLEAIDTRNPEIVHLLLQYGARVNEPARLGLKRTPLQKAAEIGSLEIVRLLLEKGADVNAAPAFRYGGTALQMAAISGNCTIATVLIEHGACLEAPPSFGKEGRWPLVGAAENGRLDMIQLLWDANFGSFDDKQCQKAMHLAEYYGHIGCRDKIAELMSTSLGAGNFVT